MTLLELLPQNPLLLDPQFETTADLDAAVSPVHGGELKQASGVVGSQPLR